MADKKLTRDEIRAALLGNIPKPASKVVSLFGTEIELRQPSLGAILDSRDTDDEKTRTADVFIRYAYVPGSNERIFENGDRAVILDWPFNDDLIEVQRVIAQLTGVDISAAEEELKADPLEESS